MPPKAANEDVERDAFVASAKAAQEQLLSGLRQFLANNKPLLSADEYEALIPRYNDGPHWTAQEEANLQANGRYAYILQEGQGLWEKNKGARQLWRLFPMVYRCLPTDLFSWAYQVDADTSKNAPIVGGPIDGQRNPIWSRNFCNMVTEFTMHGFWTYNREWDFPVMAQLMQLAVICRTNDCRPWQVVNHTEETFFTELAIEIQRQSPGVRTIKDIMDAVDARMDAKNLRPGQFRLLCRDIVTELFRPEAGPLVTGTAGPYIVIADDLKALVKALDRVAPSPERAGLSTRWPAETWRSFIEKARGRASKNQVGPQPTEGNDLLARAIAFGLMARERDQKIAERVARQMSAQSLALAAIRGTAQAQIQAQAQGAGSSSSDPFDGVDEDDGSERPRLSLKAKGKAKATSMPGGGEDTDMTDQPPASGDTQGLDRRDDDEMGDFAAGDEEHAAEPEMSERARADKEAADKWIAETLLLKAFRENRSPSPTRGLIDRGPLVRASKEYFRAWEEEDEDDI